MHDQRLDGRRVQLFNVPDDFNREGFVIEAGSAVARDKLLATRALERLIAWRRVSNSPCVL